MPAGKQQPTEPACPGARFNPANILRLVPEHNLQACTITALTNYDFLLFSKQAHKHTKCAVVIAVQRMSWDRTLLWQICLVKPTRTPKSQQIVMVGKEIDFLNVFSKNAELPWCGV